MKSDHAILSRFGGRCDCRLHLKLCPFLSMPIRVLHKNCSFYNNTPYADVSDDSMMPFQLDASFDARPTGGRKLGGMWLTKFGTWMVDRSGPSHPFLPYTTRFSFGIFRRPIQRAPPSVSSSLLGSSQDSNGTPTSQETRGTCRVGSRLLLPPPKPMHEPLRAVTP